LRGRLPRLVPAQLDEAQRKLYTAITGGERSEGAQHFSLTGDDGSLNGPFGVMLHAPLIGEALQSLGSAVRFQTNLTGRCREIAILQVAHALGSEFECWAHTRVAKAVGLADEEVMALSVGAFRSSDPTEMAVSELCANLLTSSTVTDSEYETMTEVLAPAEVIEITTLVGYYRTLAQLMTVFDIGVPESEPPEVELGSASSRLRHRDEVR
jgi:4-carboxymuconolactone decarboxylase